MFGEEDGLLRRPYSYTITCLSKDAEILCVKTSEFVGKVRPHEDTWQMLTEHCLSKKRTAN